MNSEDNELTLLDLVVAVAENLKLLIFLPVVVGLLAWGVGHTLPQSFLSQAILVVPPSTGSYATTLGSPLVLDPVIESLNLSAGTTPQAARARLAKQIKTSVGKDGLLHLDVTANTPTEAQSIANAVIDAWLKSTVPGGQARSNLEKRLDFARISLASVRQLLDRVAAEGKGGLNRSLTHGESGALLVAIGGLRDHLLDDVLNAERALKGLTRDVVVLPPTLPTDPVAPQKRVIAVVAALCSGFVLLLWVLMRQAWANAAQDPRVAEKQAKLRAALGFKSRSD
ncbi:MAG: hypothetical protein WD793_08480 [Steroidobacteraceae bacterium]